MAGGSPLVHPLSSTLWGLVVASLVVAVLLAVGVVLLVVGVVPFPARGRAPSGEQAAGGGGARKGGGRGRPPNGVIPTKWLG